MARALRIEFPGAIYHVTSRGDRREAIFEDDEDRHAFLLAVGQAMERFDAVVLAYCLMDNHYHLVIHTRAGNLSRLMQRLNGGYTQTYNRRHDKVGHLFQGRFKGILVDKDAYLLEVCRYVDLNPLRARMVRDPGNWPWSSYRAHTGKASAPPWLDTPAVQSYLMGRPAKSAADRQRAATLYVAFAAAGKGVTLWDEALSHQIYLGGAAFVERMQGMASVDATGSIDIPKQQRRKPAQLLETYLADQSGRDAGIVEAVREGQYSLTAIANALGLSVSRVSRIVSMNEGQAKGKA